MRIAGSLRKGNSDITWKKKKKISSFFLFLLEDRASKKKEIKKDKYLKWSTKDLQQQHLCPVYMYRLSWKVSYQATRSESSIAKIIEDTEREEMIQFIVWNPEEEATAWLNQRRKVLQNLEHLSCFLSLFLSWSIVLFRSLKCIVLSPICKLLAVQKLLDRNWIIPHGEDKTSGSSKSKQKEEGAQSCQCHYSYHLQLDYSSNHIVFNCNI